MMLTAMKNRYEQVFGIDPDEPPQFRTPEYLEESQYMVLQFMSQDRPHVTMVGLRILLAWEMFCSDVENWLYVICGRAPSFWSPDSSWLNGDLRDDYCV